MAFKLNRLYKLFAKVKLLPEAEIEKERDRLKNLSEEDILKEIEAIMKAIEQERKVKIRSVGSSGDPKSLMTFRHVMNMTYKTGVVIFAVVSSRYDILPPLMADLLRSIYGFFNHIRDNNYGFATKDNRRDDHQPSASVDEEYYHGIGADRRISLLTYAQEADVVIQSNLPIIPDLDEILGGVPIIDVANSIYDDKIVMYGGENAI